MEYSGPERTFSYGQMMVVSTAVLRKSRPECPGQTKIANVLQEKSEEDKH